MGTVNTGDDAIWVKHIEGDPILQERIRRLSPEALIELEVDGIVGRWQRMRNGRDGRPTLGIKPVSQMKQVWAHWRRERPRLVEIREVKSADAYLEALRGQLSEWDSPEDDLAYHDL